MLFIIPQPFGTALYDGDFYTFFTGGMPVNDKISVHLLYTRTYDIKPPTLCDVVALKNGLN